MNFWGFLLKWSGWRVSITTPRYDKCVICVAPHTSNWDFILGLFAYRSMGRKANFLMKKFWFFFPLKYALKALGGIPVERNGGKGGLTAEIIKRFDTTEYMNLAVTPEGTRKKTDKWKSGFLHIAYGAHVPILLGIIDYKRKLITISHEFIPTGDPVKDMQRVKEYYRGYADAAKDINKFTI